MLLVDSCSANPNLDKKSKTGILTSQYYVASAANGYWSNKKLDNVVPRKIGEVHIGIHRWKFINISSTTKEICSKINLKAIQFIADS